MKSQHRQGVSTLEEDSSIIHGLPSKKSIAFLEKSLVSPMGDSLLIDDGINLYVSRTNLGLSRNLDEIDQNKDKMMFQHEHEANLLQLLDIDINAQEERMNFIRDNKKRKSTLGEKFYFVDSLNRKHLQNSLNDQEKKFSILK